MASLPAPPSSRSAAGALRRPFEAAAAAEPWLGRALGAVRAAVSSMPDVEPLKGGACRWAASLGVPSDAASLLAHWQSRTPGSLRSDARYRWELSHRIGVPMPAYAGPASRWKAWRPREQSRAEREPFELEMALLVPVVLSENAELLLEQVALGGEAAERARSLLDEAAPIFRRDFARFVQATDPWADTFALWCLTRAPRALSLLHPLAIAIASGYAAEAEPGGVLRGAKFPYHEQPLASASAQLASSLLTLGVALELSARLADFVLASRRSSGGWGDADEPDDVLTTLVAADLLARIDPDFDPAPTVARLASMQGEDGLFRALGPDAPWLTLQIVSWVAEARSPFAERFRWPHRAEAMLDRKTGLPFFAYFSDLAELFAALPGLAKAETELGFIDLIGFRAFNNRFGQSAGDEVLRAFSAELETIAGARAIRDGGDEFLVVAAPTRGGLRPTLDAFRKAWPDRFRQAFGDDVPPVAPRILVARSAGRELRRLRELLGRQITSLKTAPDAHPVEGILVDAGSL